MRSKSRSLKGLSRTIEALPLMLLAGFTGFSLTIIFLLLCDALYNWLILVVAIPMALIFAYLTFKHTKDMQRPGSANEKNIVDLIILVAVIAWAGFNILYTSQHIITDRDPATYGNAAIWLTDHTDLKINYSDQFGENEAIKHSSAGFSISNGFVHAQGAHLLPALLGIAGRIVGETELLRLGPLIGALALLAVYCFARMFVRPRWALLATAITAVTLPMIYFSRGTYSEPLMMVFAFGSLAFLWLAQARQDFLLWAIAGLMAGAATMTRIDAYLVIAAYVLALAVWLIAANEKERMRKLAQSGIFIVGVAVGCILGLLDIYFLSHPYYRAHAPLVWQSLALLGAAVILSVMAIVLSWKTSLFNFLDKYTEHWRAIVLVVVLTGVGVFLASRPLWMISLADSSNEIITVLQEMEGVATEPRTYAEQSVNWLIWYLGGAVVLIGFMGILRATYLFMKGRLLLGAGLAIVVGMSIVYLWNPNITPDHLWASRRYLPVILPGLAIFAVFACQEFEVKFLKRTKEFTKFGFFAIVSASCLTLPLATSAPILTVREKTQAHLIESVCKELPENAAVIWAGMARLVLVQPTRGFCGVSATGYDNQDELTRDNLVDIAQNVRDAGKVPFIGGFEYQMSIFEAHGQHENIYFFDPAEFTVIQSTLNAPPRLAEDQEVTVFLGEIEPDGNLRPLQ